MSNIIIHPVNETYIRIECYDSIAGDLHSYFTISIPNAQYLRKKWNGKVRLLDKRRMQIYRGLIPYIKDWTKDRNLSISFSDPSLESGKNITSDDIQKIAKSLVLHNNGNPIQPTNTNH